MYFKIHFTGFKNSENSGIKPRYSPGTFGHFHIFGHFDEYFSSPFFKFITNCTFEIKIQRYSVILISNLQFQCLNDWINVTCPLFKSI